jgi:hypothetical protein
VHEKAPWNGEYEVIGDVGGAKTEITRKRGLNPKNRISGCMGSILSGGGNDLWCGWKDPIG